MSRALLLALLLLAASPAAAERMKLSIDQLEHLQQSILFVGRERDVVAKVDGKEQVVKKPYELSGNLLMRLARDSVAIKEVMDAFQSAQISLFKKLSGGKPNLCPVPDRPQGAPPPKPEEQASCEALNQFNEQVRDLRLAPQEVGLWTITEAELKIDENRFPPAVLAGLVPIIAEPPK